MFRFISPILAAVFLFGVACRETPEPSARARALGNYRPAYRFVEKFRYAEKEEDFFSLRWEGPEAAESFVKGWSAVERNETGAPFVWVIGREAEIGFSVVERGERELVLRCGPMESPTGRAQGMNVRVNGRWVAHRSLEPGVRRYSFRIPAAVLQEGRNRLGLRFAYAASPSTVMPGSPDERTLAAAVFGLRIFPPGRDGADAFALRIRESGKEAPAIDQARGTLLRYYLQVAEGARLVVSLQAEDERPVEYELRIDTDPPGPARRLVFSSPPKKRTAPEPRSVDLAEFSGMIARFQFRASGGSWVDPVIWAPPAFPEDAERRDASPERCIERLRRLHAHANLVLCLLDAANPSHFGCYGYSKQGTTPAIDAIAQAGTRFSNAFTQAPFTLCAIGSLFTGLFPESHGVMNRHCVLAKQTPVLAEALRKEGFETAGFVDTYAGASAYRYNRGFAAWSEVFRERREGLYDWRRADFIRREVIPWIGKNRGSRFFLYLHLRQPHSPYLPPSPFLRGLLPGVQGKFDGSVDSLKALDEGAAFSQADQDYLKGFYDGNLAVADEALGALFSRLEHLDLLKNTVVLILADHGEAFGEHGRFEHSSTLYDEMIRIPMIWKFADHCDTPKVVTQDVCLADVFPTVADLFSMERTRMRFDGRSILPWLCGARVPESRWIYSRTTEKANLASLRNDEYKLIQDLDSGKTELFDLRGDPGEKKSRVEALPVTAGYLKARLAEMREAMKEKAPGSMQTLQPDKGILEDMRALGYID